MVQRLKTTQKDRKQHRKYKPKLGLFCLVWYWEMGVWNFGGFGMTDWVKGTTNIERVTDFKEVSSLHALNLTSKVHTQRPSLDSKSTAPYW